MRALTSITGVVLALGLSASAEDWAQWRGPDRNGLVPADAVPAQWPASTRQGWRVEVGEGYASPIVASGRVFVHSRRDPDEIVTAMDLASGEVAWQQTYGAVFTKNPYATRMAKGPNATPLVSGGRLYTLGATGMLTAWNTTDGAKVWQHDYSASIDTSVLFCGTAASPLLDNGRLIVQVGSDVHGGRVLALDPATGAERWVWTGPGPGYASPLAATIGGVRQIVTLTNQSVVGLDSETGALLWSIPFADEWHENIVSPTWTGDALIVSGTRQGTHAYRIEREDGVWRPAQAWRNAEVTMYMASPVFAGGVLYGMSNKRRGQFVALDAATGTLRWATEGRDGDFASVLQTNRHLLLLNNEGRLIVARRTPDAFIEEHRYEVSTNATWAQPVLLPGGLVVRDASGVTRLFWE